MKTTKQQLEWALQNEVDNRIKEANKGKQTL